jgi:hypothetical protein
MPRKRFREVGGLSAQAQRNGKIQNWPDWEGKPGI